MGRRPRSQTHENVRCIQGIPRVVCSEADGALESGEGIFNPFFQARHLGFSKGVGNDPIEDREISRILENGGHLRQGKEKLGDVPDYGEKYED